MNFATYWASSRGRSRNRASAVDYSRPSLEKGAPSPEGERVVRSATNTSWPNISRPLGHAPARSVVRVAEVLKELTRRFCEAVRYMGAAHGTELLLPSPERQIRWGQCSLQEMA